MMGICGSDLGFCSRDKAGSFALELTHLYKIREKPSIFSSNKNGRRPGSAYQSRRHQLLTLLLKSTFLTGQTGLIRERNFNNTWLDTAGYTSNWAPTMQLFSICKTCMPATRWLIAPASPNSWPG